MRIISVKTLYDVAKKHKDLLKQVEIWVKCVRQQDWAKPSQVKELYGTADILPGNRVVFNIKGNTYRIVCKIKYSWKVVYVRFFGTHAEYDRIDATTI